MFNKGLGFLTTVVGTDELVESGEVDKADPVIEPPTIIGVATMGAAVPTELVAGTEVKELDLGDGGVGGLITVTTPGGVGGLVTVRGDVVLGELITLLPTDGMEDEVPLDNVVDLIGDKGLFTVFIALLRLGLLTELGTVDDTG